MNSCWDSYQKTHIVLAHQRSEVNKALDCYDINNGSFVYFCNCCNKYIFQSLGCNSRICSCCGKRYTDQWSNSLSKAMFKVPHRHFVMSVPDSLWSFLREWRNLKTYMDSAIIAFSDYFSKILRSKIKVGVIIILHPFGKDLKFQPHLHILLTEGGFDQKGTFRKCVYINANGFRKTWQYHVLKEFQKKDLSNTLVSLMFKKYSNGFYVWLHSRGTIKSPKDISRYVGRYVRHPAIANSRIDFFDGQIVKFHYINGEDILINVEMKVDTFISALIQHIPPKQFKMIRYYGAYARTIKSRFGARVQSSIKQLKLFDFGLERIKKCPICKNTLSFVYYLKKNPPDLVKFNNGLVNWINI